MQLAGKLAGLAQLAAVAARLLVHIVDELSGKHFLVDTGVVTVFCHTNPLLLRLVHGCSGRLVSLYLVGVNSCCS
jgi:hypothetical protein